jgi:peptide chain release factor
MENNPGSAKIQALNLKMKSLGVSEEDLDEKFVRSQGKGGQKVNKSSTCVYLKHKPSGIEVKCQQTRSQNLNRFLARRILAGKIEALKSGKLSQERSRIYKIRKQKKRRTRRAKDKMLKDKAHLSVKKADRSYRVDLSREGYL